MVKNWIDKVKSKRAIKTGTTDNQVLQYADGFRHGFDAGKASCVGDVSVSTLIKELIDRNELDNAKWLIEELQSRDY